MSGRTVAWVLVGIAVLAGGLLFWFQPWKSCGEGAERITDRPAGAAVETCDDYRRWGHPTR